MDAIVAAVIRHQAIGSNTPSSAMSDALPNRWLRDGVTSATDRGLPLKPFICVLWGISGLFVKTGVRVGRVARAIFSGRPTKLDTLIPNGNRRGKILTDFGKNGAGCFRSPAVAPNRGGTCDGLTEIPGPKESVVRADGPNWQVRNKRPASTGNDFR
jgi:hypothetical protein